MMIQNSNPVSMLSGAENGGTLPQGLLGDAANAVAFTSALMQQLATLQANPANSNDANAGMLAALQQAGKQLPDGAVAGQSLQNFAALFGKNLPTAKTSDKDIDLDGTLNALADVLKSLESLETGSPQPDATSSQILVADQSAVEADAQAQAETQQNVDPAMLAAAMPTVAPDAMPNQQAEQQLPPSEQLSPSEQADQAAQAQISKAVSSTPADAEMATTTIAARLLPSGKLAQVGVTGSGKHEVFKLAQDAEGKQGLSFDSDSIAALLGNNVSAAEKSGHEHQGEAGGDKLADQTLPAKGAEDKLADLTNQSKAPENENKNISRMMADIAQLNQTVGSEKAVATPAMSKPFAHPEWNTELGEKLVWMHKQDLPSAELRLNPQHLGPVTIKIDVNQDQANVTFTTPHAAVKEAIEAAIPKLREMLGGQQLNLADVNVSQQQSEQRQPRDFFQASADQGSNKARQNDEAEIPVNEIANDIADEIEAGRAIASNGLLSLFA